MSPPFPASLRRNPDDPRGLLERIDAQLRERLEEAVEFFCLDLLVKVRRAGNRSLPEEKSARDRREFEQLVGEFLAFLRSGFLERLDKEEAARLRSIEREATGNPAQRLVAFQVQLAKALPEYWQVFDEYTARFTRQRLPDSAPEPGQNRPG